MAQEAGRVRAGHTVAYRPTSRLTPGVSLLAGAEVWQGPHWGLSATVAQRFGSDYAHTRDALVWFACDVSRVFP